jgi:hypothetical protein
VKLLLEAAIRYSKVNFFAVDGKMEKVPAAENLLDKKQQESKEKDLSAAQGLAR